MCPAGNPSFLPLPLGEGCGVREKGAAAAPDPTAGGVVAKGRRGVDACDKHKSVAEVPLL